MCPDSPLSQPARFSDTEIAALVRAFLAGDPTAAERLSVPLMRHAALTVGSFLGSSEAEASDIVQESVLAVLGWLGRRTEFSGDLISFTISVTRNRCRNYVAWRRRLSSESLDDGHTLLADSARSPLEALLAAEDTALLQEAVDSLDPACRNLLHAVYYQMRHMEDLRREAGLRSLQAMYDRRKVCLGKVEKFLKIRTADCSSPREWK